MKSGFGKLVGFLYELSSLGLLIPEDLSALPLVRYFMHSSAFALLLIWHLNFSSQMHDPSLHSIGAVFQVFHFCSSVLKGSLAKLKTIVVLSSFLSSPKLWIMEMSSASQAQIECRYQV